jgi:hypothetical protein
VFATCELQKEGSRVRKSATPALANLAQGIALYENAGAILQLAKAKPSYG